MLTEGVRREDLTDLFKNVSFITFNYDRCIEQYLALWLESYYRISDSDAQSLVRQMTIVHPYGRIGPLPWENPTASVHYGADPERHNLAALAKNIRTFTEQVDDETVPEKMKQLVADAGQIVYLGFSFGSQNLDLLKPENATIYRHAYATSLGISPQNTQMIKLRLNRDFVIHGQRLLNDAHFEESTCFKLLNDYYRVFTQ